MSAPEAARPPQFTVLFACSGAGADHVWTPYDDRYMIRATDCPADPDKNRKLVCDLRLTSGTTAVHRHTEL